MERTTRLGKWEPLGVGVVLYGYAILLGAAYMLAYWRPFGFDIFPYISPQLLLTLPLNRLSILLAPVALVGLVLFLNWGIKARIPRLLFIGLAALHVWLIFSNFSNALERYKFLADNYNNEKSILVYIPLLALLAGIFIFQALRERHPMRFQIASLALLQLSAVLAAGYADGKAVYLGGDRTFFLENPTACEPDPVRHWVYLGRFDSQTIFMNTIEKRICILQNAQFTLTPRSLVDGKLVD